MFALPDYMVADASSICLPTNDGHGARLSARLSAKLRPVTTCSTSSRARGARRAGAGHRTGIAPREGTADCKAAQHPPAAGWPPEDPCRAGRRLPSFGPSGHVGAGAHSPPRPTARATRRNVSGGARGHGAEPSLRRPHCEALQDHGSRSYVLASLRALHLDRES